MKTSSEAESFLIIDSESRRLLSCDPRWPQVLPGAPRFVQCLWFRSSGKPGEWTACFVSEDGVQFRGTYDEAENKWRFGRVSGEWGLPGVGDDAKTKAFALSPGWAGVIPGYVQVAPDTPVIGRTQKPITARPDPGDAHWPYEILGQNDFVANVVCVSWDVCVNYARNAFAPGFGQTTLMKAADGTIGFSATFQVVNGSRSIRLKGSAVFGSEEIEWDSSTLMMGSY